MSIEPLNDGVLVKIAEPEKTSKGGIIIPEQAKMAPQRGEVLAVGPGKEEVCGDGSFATPAPRVAVGDVVLFAKYAGVTLDDGTILLKAHDLLAKVSP